MSISQPNLDNAYLAEHVRLILTSYRHWFSEDLVAAPAATPTQAAQRLFEAEFAVLSHNSAADPMLNYANRAALTLFELDWAQLLITPSRLTAERVNRQAREQLLAEVSAKGYIANYAGVRISRTGKRFHIENAKVWNLIDAENGEKVGQAALLTHWRFL